jgi:hypothetical protein
MKVAGRSGACFLATVPRLPAVCDRNRLTAARDDAFHHQSGPAASRVGDGPEPAHSDLTMPHAESPVYWDMPVLIDATPEEQESQARKLLDTLTLPPEISSFDMRLETDAAGERALWITLHVRSDVATGKPVVERLTRFASEVQSAILQDGVRLFPYTFLE